MKNRIIKAKRIKRKLVFTRTFPFVHIATIYEYPDFVVKPNETVWIK